MNTYRMNVTANLIVDRVAATAEAAELDIRDNMQADDIISFEEVTHVSHVRRLPSQTELAAASHLKYLLNELRAFGTPGEAPGDKDSILAHLERLKEFIRESSGFSFTQQIDVLGICKETLSQPVQA
jgi:hypothetical protein